MAAPAPPSLSTLVAALPEVYQPILGHPELSGSVSRGCEDRLALVQEVYRSLATRLGRPLRVLDLGCAQGFFSLSLAALGARVHGVDWLEANIAVCRALELPGQEVTFQTGRIEDVLAGLEPDQYDLVLGLSVFHHLAHRLGAAEVAALLGSVATKTLAGVFELALATEPLAWAKALPGNPRDLLAGYAFVHELGASPTHLSGLCRPLFFASNGYWFLDGRAEPFDQWTTSAHALLEEAERGTRCLYFGGGLLVKVYALDAEEWRTVNIREHENEVRFLVESPASLETPALLLHGRHEREVWLVRELLPGEPLLDLIRSGRPFDAGAVLREILAQLAALEAAGLYHCDLRTWNVLVDGDGHATLLDYGSIDRAPKDCAWPHNVFLAFMLFCQEVLGRDKQDAALPLRTPALDPEAFPEPQRGIFRHLFELPAQTWSFALFLDAFTREPKGPELPVRGQGLALQAMAEACAVYQGAVRFWRGRAQAP